MSAVPVETTEDVRAMTFDELKRFLQISEFTLRSEIAKPGFPYFRVGKQYRFWPSDVQAYYRRQQMQEVRR